MTPQELVQRHLTESIRTKERLLTSAAASMVAAGELLAEAIRSGHKVLFCGNGGSAADSQHLATELVVRLSSEFERPALAAIALTTDTSLLTACANDYGFEHVFERQVEGLGRAGDVLVGISTSGRSPNVVRALKKAQELGMGRVVFSAGDGDACAALADVSILVPSDTTSHIQECHLTVGHILCELVERLACGRT